MECSQADNGTNVSIYSESYIKGVDRSVSTRLGMGLSAVQRPYSLMLGMIYGNFSGTPDEIGKMVEHTMQLRGDTARCIVTEESTGKDVYTLDNREGENHRVGRHIEQDLKKIDLNHPLMIAIKGRVDQICLDHLLCLSLTFLLLLEQNGLQRPTKIVWIIHQSRRS